MHNPVPKGQNQDLWFMDLFDPGNLKPGIPRVFHKEGLGRVAALKTTYKHNMFCPDEVRARLEGYKITYLRT